MGKKILFIDGDQQSVNSFCTALKTEGFDVLCVADSKTGLEHAKNDKPDLILLGQMLQDAKGNEFLQTLKSTEETKNIPVAILSNFAQKELVQDAINHGAADYIIKYQVEPPDLLKRVKELLPQPHQA